VDILAQAYSNVYVYGVMESGESHADARGVYGNVDSGNLSGSYLTSRSRRLEIFKSVVMT
jgi:hypothetical protein